MAKAKLVGSIDLSKHMRKVKTKKVKCMNRDGDMNHDMARVAQHLRHHGVTVDGDSMTLKGVKGLGIKLLGQVDFLKSKGFSVVTV